MQKVKLISKTLAWVLLTALNFVETRFIDRIPNMDVRTGAKLLLDPIRKMIDALSDEEPRNEEQVLQLWRQFINTDFADFGAVQLDKLVKGIENEQLRGVLSILISPAIDLTRAMTDENPANDKQALAILNQFIENPDVHEVFLNDLLKPILEKVVKDPATVAFILTLVAQALENATDGSLKKEQRNKVITNLRAEVQQLEAAA